MNFDKKLREIITYHSDEGTSGYLLSEEQISEIKSLISKLIKEAKPERQLPLYFLKGQRVEAYNDAIDEFESNLNKKLEMEEKDGNTR